MALPPSSSRAGRFRLAVLVCLAAAVALVLYLVPGGGSRSTAQSRGARARGRATGAAAGRPSSAALRRPAASAARGSLIGTIARCPCPNLAPGSNPSVLPGAVLVADHLNNRLLIIEPNGTVAWQFPQPGDLAPGQTFKVPDDAFFTPDGRYIVTTEEDDFVISLISVAEHRIVWRYGTPGVPGSSANHLDNPDDAMMMPDGNIITADIKNCRILILRPPYHYPLRVYGETTNDCYHQPPARWGSPNGAFPMADGHYLITEINGDWVDSLSLNGSVGFSTNPPGVAYPSDTNEVRPGLYLTADYSDPGQVEEFNTSGQLVWRYRPTGGAAMNQPSLALPMPNGDILCNDDFNDRVIVIDPRTDKVVWQYGHKGVTGTAPGYLNDPDGVDLAPPYSLTISRAATMGEYPVPPGSPPVPGATAPAGVTSGQRSG
jgi:outer membrane protein assembly factor BamB